MTWPDGPAPGTRLFYLEDEGVLFCGRTQQLHRLNHTATIIFSLMEEGHDPASAARELQKLCALDAATSADYVATAIAEWTANGILGAPAPLPEAPAATAAAGPSDAPPWQPFESAVECRYRILDSVFRVRFSTKELAEVVHAVLEHLATDESAYDPVAVDIVQSAATILVYRDRTWFGGCHDLRELAPIVKALVWQSAVNNHDYFLDIHAGVVGDDRRCVLLPAAAGSGKSTLTAALVHAGFLYYSDEVALLEDRTLSVFPVPLALCVKSTGVAALQGRFPILRTLPAHLRGDGKLVHYMPIPSAQCPEGTHPRPACAIVFPRYSPGTATTMTRMGKASALQRLLGECLVAPKGLDVTRVAALVDWICRTECFELTYSVTDDATARVSEAFAATAATAT